LDSEWKGILIGLGAAVKGSLNGYVLTFRMARLDGNGRACFRDELRGLLVETDNRTIGVVRTSMDFQNVFYDSSRSIKASFRGQRPLSRQDRNTPMRLDPK